MVENKSLVTQHPREKAIAKLAILQRKNQATKIAAEQQEALKQIEQCLPELAERYLGISRKQVSEFSKEELPILAGLVDEKVKLPAALSRLSEKTGDGLLFAILGIVIAGGGTMICLSVIQSLPLAILVFSSGISSFIGGFYLKDLPPRWEERRFRESYGLLVGAHNKARLIKLEDKR